MRCCAVVLLALAVAPLYGQAALSSGELAKADLVVVGTLHRDFKFPWLDGWNERGHIEVERVLKGQIGAVRILRFAWERDFRQGWCMTRPDWRAEVGKRGVWLLKRDGRRYRAPLFSGFFGPDQLDKVLRLLSDLPK
jgi:hypothetical protein